MKINRSMSIAIILAGAISIIGCSDRGARSPEPSPAARPEAAAPAPAAEPEAAAAGTAASPAELPAAAEETSAPAPTEATSQPVPAATSEPAAVAAEPAVRSAPESTPASPPAPEAAAARIEVRATKAGLTRIGAEKCKMCHKLQYDSWAATKHAAESPALDCESCHGPGSEYKVMAIMKDPAQAKAAGLVMPGKEFCVKCHQDNWSDDMIAKVHAHKKK